jgi:hypothetical protein
VNWHLNKRLTQPVERRSRKVRKRKDEEKKERKK